MGRAPGEATGKSPVGLHQIRVVQRRCAVSTGNKLVFDDALPDSRLFAALGALFGRLSGAMQRSH
jgi:hypothetical protein